MQFQISLKRSVRTYTTNLIRLPERDKNGMLFLALQIWENDRKLMTTQSHLDEARPNFSAWCEHSAKTEFEAGLQDI